jgi:hypothetical protein
LRRFVWWLAPAWALAASTYLLFEPTVGTVSTSVASGLSGPAVPSRDLYSSSSLLATQGSSVLLPLLIPVVLSALPLFGRSPRWHFILGAGAAALLGLFCLLGILSVGFFYVPSLVALIVALALQTGRSEASPS